MRKRSLLPLVSAGLLTSTLVAGRPSPAGAESPDKYGWWAEWNTGLTPLPSMPQTRPGGLYVANAARGPAAIAALTYEMAPGSTAHLLTLRVSGQPVVSQPPVACPILASGADYQPAQGGPWTDAPAYDCNHLHVRGREDHTGTSFSFDIAPMIRNGTVSVVILAGGPADQMAFDPPDSRSLGTTATNSAPGSSGTPPTPAPVTSLTPSSHSELAAQAVPDSMAPSPGPQVASTLANRTEISATNSAPGYVAPGLPPAVVPQQSTTPGPRSGPGLASRLGRSLGLATLVFLLGAYGLGYGILGGRFGRFGIAGDEDLPM